jgi:hypothetical protein
MECQTLNPKIKNTSMECQTLNPKIKNTSMECQTQYAKMQFNIKTNITYERNML